MDQRPIYSFFLRLCTSISDKLIYCVFCTGVAYNYHDDTSSSSDSEEDDLNRLRSKSIEQVAEVSVQGGSVPEGSVNRGQINDNGPERVTVQKAGRARSDSSSSSAITTGGAEQPSVASAHSTRGSRLNRRGTIEHSDGASTTLPSFPADSDVSDELTGVVGRVSSKPPSSVHTSCSRTSQYIDQHYGSTPESSRGSRVPEASGHQQPSSEPLVTDHSSTYSGESSGRISLSHRGGTGVENVCYDSETQISQSGSYTAYSEVVSEFGVEHEMISKCGSIQVQLTYASDTQKLTGTIIQARDVPGKDRGGFTHTSVHVTLLPQKKPKFKTKQQKGTHPHFKENFKFSSIGASDVLDMGLRLRLYGKVGIKEQLIGEIVVKFAEINLLDKTPVWLSLEPRSEMSRGESPTGSVISRTSSNASLQSMQHGGLPELSLGLSYNAVTGRLNVELQKGSHFKNLAQSKPPDTYVKIVLLSPNGNTLSRTKTTVRRGQPNPAYMETFVFQVPQFQLTSVTLMLSIYARRGMKKKEMIGWFSMGLNNSSEDELQHWTDMREAKGQQIIRWHSLLES